MKKGALDSFSYQKSSNPFLAQTGYWLLITCPAPSDTVVVALAGPGNTGEISLALQVHLVAGEGR